jgi:hypothetical protein
VLPFARYDPAMRHFIEGAAFDPTMLVVIGTAFDRAWSEIENHFGDTDVDLARSRLAEAILIVAADHGNRDVRSAKDRSFTSFGAGLSQPLAVELALGAAGQRVSLAMIEFENILKLEAIIAHFHSDPPLRPLRQLFDGKPNGICAASKAPIGHRTLFGAPACCDVDLSRRIVIEIAHSAS